MKKWRGYKKKEPKNCIIASGTREFEQSQVAYDTVLKITSIASAAVKCVRLVHVMFVIVVESVLLSVRIKVKNNFISIQCSMNKKTD